MKKIYLVLQRFDEGYDSVETDIKFVTTNEEKAKKKAEEYVKINKNEHNLEIEIEVWENDNYLETIYID